MDKGYTYLVFLKSGSRSLRTCVQLLACDLTTVTNTLPSFSLTTQTRRHITNSALSFDKKPQPCMCLFHTNFKPGH